MIHVTPCRSANNACGAVSSTTAGGARIEVNMTMCLTGTSHPTITSVEQGISVLQRFRSQYQPPDAWEGCDQMLTLGVDEQPASSQYTLEDITNILEKLRASPRILPSTWDLNRASNAGRGRGPYQPRGAYQPRGYSRGWGAPPRGRDGYSGGWGNASRCVHHIPLMPSHSLSPTGT